MKLKVEIQSAFPAKEILAKLLEVPGIALHVYGYQPDPELSAKPSAPSLAEQYRTERKAQRKTKPRKRWPELVYQGDDYNARVDIEATLAKNSWSEDEIMRNVQPQNTAKMALKNALRMRNRLRTKAPMEEPAA